MMSHSRLDPARYAPLRWAINGTMSHSRGDGTQQSRRLQRMGTTTRKTWASGLAMIAVVAIGCGGGGGGSGSTSGSGTISGNISNQSAALRMKVPTTLLARLGRFFSPVTAALAEHSGIQVIVHNLETMTDQNGSFVITGTGSGTQTVTFSNGNGSFTLDVTVPPGSIVVLR